MAAREPPDKDSPTPPTRREAGLTRREAMPGASTTRREAAADIEAPAVHSFVNLPPELARRVSIVQEMPTFGSEADLLLVEDKHGTRFVAKIYRPGIEPNSEVLERISHAAPEHVIILDAFGRPEGRSRAWELIEYATFGSLRDLLRQDGPKLDHDQVEMILKELSAALASLHGQGIEHRDLKPENVLVRSRDPFDLVLSDFGIASIVDASIHFTSASRTIRYGPPEAIGGAVYKGAWDHWSLGIILVEALTGKHPFDGLSDQVAMNLLTTRPVDEFAAGVEDGRWRLLCRGLLRRGPKNRWGRQEIERWLRREPSLTVAEEAARPQGSAKPFRFLGRDHHTLSELAQSFSDNWNDAADLWRRQNQAIRDWIKHEIGQADVAANLERIDQEQGLDLDVQIFSVIASLDPHLAPRFRDVVLSQEGLLVLANRAESDPTAAEMLRWLYRSRVMQIASALPEREDLQIIQSAWTGAVADYDRCIALLRSSSVPIGRGQLDDSRLVRLLSAVVPGNDLLARLEHELQRVASPEALECPWFRDLAGPGKRSPAAMLLAPLVVRDAETATRTIRARRAEEERTIRERRAIEEKIDRDRRNETETWKYTIFASIFTFCFAVVILICANWPRPLQIPQSHPSVSSTDNRRYCAVALNWSRTAWDTLPAYEKAVAAAKSNGLTVERCRAILSEPSVPAEVRPEAPGGSDNLICWSALNSFQTSWSTLPTSGFFVREARRRGLTIAKCQDEIGVHPDPDSVICTLALNDSKTAWDNRPSYADTVAEVQRRGLSIEACRTAVSQDGSTPSASLVVPALAPSPAAAQDALRRSVPLAVPAPTSGLSDFVICVQALNASRTAWDIRPTYATAVAEAQRRGISIASCIQLTGQTPQPERQPQSSNALSPSDQDVCNASMSRDGASWEGDVTEVTRRGLSIDRCRQLTGRALQPGPTKAKVPSTRSGEPGWTRTAGGCLVLSPDPSLDYAAIWSGRCEGGRANGKGTLVWEFSKSGEKLVRRCECEMLNGKVNGHGVLNTENGSRYEGNFLNNKVNGRGSITFANGDRYEGEFKDGTRSGQGVYTTSAGIRVEGEFHDNKANGRAVITWPNGNRYDGQLREDVRIGRGTFTWPNGVRYEGEYRNNQPNGLGRLITPTGTFDGTWMNGCFKDGSRRAAAEADLSSCP